jgi:hypothetical protein
MLKKPIAESRVGQRIARWIRWQDEWLRVVLVDESDTMFVIAVIWPARPPRQ